MDSITKIKTPAPQEPQNKYDPLCAEWFQSAGDIDDFIFYGEDYRGSER